MFLLALVVALHHGVMMEVDVWKRKRTGVARSTYASSAEAHAKLYHPRDPHFTRDLAGHRSEPRAVV